MKKDYVRIFDTTLRDGEQSPGCSMNTAEKLKVAQQLAKLHVDVIEAGFPIASPGDFEAVSAIAREVKGPVIAGLCRATQKDIDAAWGAVRHAAKPRIHTFIATSPIHMAKKLNKAPDAVLAQAVEAVRYARSLCADVEFSAEDAGRSDQAFLRRITEAVIAAGASTVNIPDTTGYAIPEEFGARIADLMAHVPNIGKAVIAVHCHNDLGMATANSLAAVKAGARQIECTLNGIGERAGNTAMEEVVMALHTRARYFGVETKIRTTEIWPASRLLTQIIGVGVQPNKAIVGANAFAHESGIHQDGMLKSPETYEIMTPASIGLPTNTLVMGKHSGRHALKKRLASLGCHLEGEALNAAFERFKRLADKKKEIFDEDLIAIAETESESERPPAYAMTYLHTSSGTETIPTATVVLEQADGTKVQDAACGDGPVDAIYRVIDRLTGVRPKLTGYALAAVTEGADAQGEVNIRIEQDGLTVRGKGASTDVVEASARAYLDAVNRLLARREK